ncbi:hypothetical protein V8B97DRAFT_2009682 [Scleroderma yunnanense]
MSQKKTTQGECTTPPAVILADSHRVTLQPSRVFSLPPRSLVRPSTNTLASMPIHSDQQRTYDDDRVKLVSQSPALLPFQLSSHGYPGTNHSTTARRPSPYTPSTLFSRVDGKTPRDLARLSDLDGVSPIFHEPPLSTLVFSGLGRAVSGAKRKARGKNGRDVERGYNVNRVAFATLACGVSCNCDSAMAIIMYATPSIYRCIFVPQYEEMWNHSEMKLVISMFKITPLTLQNELG